MDSDSDASHRDSPDIVDDRYEGETPQHVEIFSHSPIRISLVKVVADALIAPAKKTPKQQKRH